MAVSCLPELYNLPTGVNRRLKSTTVDRPQQGASSVITKKICDQLIYTSRPYIFISFKQSVLNASPCQSAILAEAPGENEKEARKRKWIELGPDLTKEQEHAISQISPKMTKRCKALLKHVMCWSPTHDHDSLQLLLDSWDRVMKPRRADWLAVIKEMNRLECPLVLEVMEHALAEDSFEANVRDYTKLIHGYAKKDLISSAENAFQAMKRKGFLCDQITLTVLVDMYSKSGDLNRAKETFEEIKMLELPLDKRAYGSMIMAYIRAGKLELAESLMQEVAAQQTYAGKEVYKAILRAYSTIGDSSGAQRVFDSIQVAGIVPDDKLCALLVNAYCEAGNCSKARIVLENMRLVGIKPNDKSLALILNSYEKLNNLDEALAFLMDLEKDGILVGPESSDVLVRWFRRLGVLSEVEQVLREYCKERES